jgi:hypothetical protein
MASHRHGTVKVCFTKEQLLSLLDKFTLGLSEPAFQAQLASLAPNEAKMEEFINESQISIIREHLPGIPPNAVFGDMGRASQAFAGDEEVLAALANISLAENRALTAAMSAEAPSDPLIQISPQVMKQVAEQAQSNPEAFRKQQQMMQMMYGSVEAMEKLKEHMKTMESSNPQAYATFTQTLAAAAFFTPEHKHEHGEQAPQPTTGAPSAQKADDDDMPPLQDLDDDLEDNMN